MSLCFICGANLEGGYTQMSSCVMPYSKMPYLEKIAELLGDEFVIIVNSTDNMCLKCTSLLSHMDKLENDVKLVKNAMLSHIQKKYGILPPEEDVESVKTLKMLNEQTADKLKSGQSKVKNDSSLIETLTEVITPVKTPIKLRKIQPQQEQKTEQIQKQQNNANDLKTLNCGTRVQSHTLTYLNKKEPETSVTNQTAAILTPVLRPKKKVFYKCQLCFESFNSRLLCLEHIQKEHKKQQRPLAFNSMSENIDKTVKESIEQSDPEKEKEEKKEEVHNEDAEKEVMQSEASNSVKNEDNKNSSTNEDTTKEIIKTKVFFFM